VVAKIRCTIWSSDLRRIRARFARDGLELQLQRGTVVGLQCVVQFHASHGLSVRVIDMDPAFVLGELELRRRRIMLKLEQDGLLGRNGERAVPLLPNRVVLYGNQRAFGPLSAAFHARTRYGWQRRVSHLPSQGCAPEPPLGAAGVQSRLALNSPLVLPTCDTDKHLALQTASLLVMLRVFDAVSAELLDMSAMACNPSPRASSRSPAQ